jgi:hypothetical protein
MLVHWQSRLPEANSGCDGLSVGTILSCVAIRAQAIMPTPGKYKRRLVNVHKKEG